MFSRQKSHLGELSRRRRHCCYPCRQSVRHGSGCFRHSTVSTATLPELDATGGSVRRQCEARLNAARRGTARLPSSSSLVSMQIAAAAELPPLQPPLPPAQLPPPPRRKQQRPRAAPRCCCRRRHPRGSQGYGGRDTWSEVLTSATSAAAATA